ncbi:hypothetical protein F511_33587 [Dorcoceras hygrometricum]|uniref:Uncharacterized protein n=1 Tax=Dorcoceras hygrometricum TaxID=472368 RepID=A0A2Z7ADP0_9LAMI|nr:hypothetical protein F511_33587 [Dorcoceras hygrometricum]
MGVVKKGGAAPKRKMVLESLDSESTVSLPLVKITKKLRTQRKKPAKKAAGNKAESNPGPAPEIPAEAEDVSTTAVLDGNVETTESAEEQAVDKEHSIVRFRTGYRLNKVTSMKLVEEFAKIEDILLSWAETEKMVRYTAHRENNSEDEEDFTQAGLQQIDLSRPQANLDTAKELTSLKDLVSSLGSKIDRIGVVTYITKHTTLQFRQQLETKIDWLEANLIHHFSDSQPNLAGDIALLKLQVAEMVECLKEIRDAKKGEGRTN